MMDSIILRTTTRLLFPLMLVFSVFLLIRGHNEPGGGFAGGLTAATAFALVLASDALTTILGRPLVPDVMVQTYRTAGILPVYWLALVVAAPLFEEVLFRGFLLEGLRHSRLGPVGAVVLTSLAWVAVHQQYGPYELATIFVVGLVLGTARVTSGSLYPSLLIHAGFNLVATIQTALALQTVNWPGAG